PCSARTQWLDQLRALLPPDAAWIKVPTHVNDGRLLGEIDLAATLRAGRPITDQGLLARAHGGVLVLAMAERHSSATAARIASALDQRVVPRAHTSAEPAEPARLGVIALDEGIDHDERPPAVLRERLAFEIELDPRYKGHEETNISPANVAAARQLLPRVRASDAMMGVLCEAADAVGAWSLRAPLLALRAARAAAALEGRIEVTTDDTALAARLVLAHRATRLPAEPESEQSDEESKDASDPADSEASDGSDDVVSPKELEDVVVAAAKASIPAGLLAELTSFGRGGNRPGNAGRLIRSRLRGRSFGSQPGEPRGGARLDLLATMHAAAPWQRIRNSALGAGSTPRARLQIARQDLRIHRYQQRARTVAIFVVDASGSSALHRLAEAKGAVETFLADCYVRREEVALIAFRGKSAELLLPPTRSLARAKRCLAGLPGGGTTPLAAALKATTLLADSIQRRGDTVLAVLLTDGRGNVALNGSPDSATAHSETRQLARHLKSTGLRTLLIDTSPRPRLPAEELAADLGATYLAMPHAGAVSLARSVKGMLAS
ncbi:MAG: magnesium chelatase subunit D, partial [Burkholderiaceae bacterium]